MLIKKFVNFGKSSPGLHSSETGKDAACISSLKVPLAEEHTPYLSIPFPG